MLFTLLFLVCMLKYSVFGFHYFPVLDDFIQYDGYPLYDSLSYVYFYIGTIATRPLAAILDPLLWGALSGGISLFIITVMHFFSAVFFYKAAEKLGIILSSVFGIIYLLLPLGFESFYWLSASTRVVCGLFFSSAGIFFLADFISSGGKSRIFGFWLFTLLSGGFYEAALAFSCSCSLLIMIFFRKKIRQKWVFAIPFANGAVLCGIYSALSNVGMMGSRAESFSVGSLFTLSKISSFFSQLKESLSVGIFELTKNSFLSGINVLLCGKLLPAFLLIVFFAVSLCFFIKKRETVKSSAYVFIFAAIMFFAPLAVNFLAEEVWITFRSLGFSIFAIALFADRLISLIGKNSLTGIISAVFAFAFLVCSAGEYCSYKTVSEFDVSLSKKIYEQLDNDVLSGEKETVVIFDKFPDAFNKTVLYKDHVKSVVFEDWSLTGAVRAQGSNIKIKKVTPLDNDGKFEKDNVQIIYADENFNIKGGSVLEKD